MRLTLLVTMLLVGVSCFDPAVKSVLVDRRSQVSPDMGMDTSPDGPEEMTQDFCSPENCQFWAHVPPSTWVRLDAAAEVVEEVNFPLELEGEVRDFVFDGEQLFVLVDAFGMQELRLCDLTSSSCTTLLLDVPPISITFSSLSPSGVVGLLDDGSIREVFYNPDLQILEYGLDVFTVPPALAQQTSFITIDLFTESIWALLPAHESREQDLIAHIQGDDVMFLGTGQVGLWGLLFMGPDRLWTISPEGQLLVLDAEDAAVVETYPPPDAGPFISLSKDFSSGF